MRWGHQLTVGKSKKEQSGSVSADTVCLFENLIKETSDCLGTEKAGSWVQTEQVTPSQGYYHDEPWNRSKARREKEKRRGLMAGVKVVRSRDWKSQQSQRIDTWRSGQSYQPPLLPVLSKQLTTEHFQDSCAFFPLVTHSSLGFKYLYAKVLQIYVPDPSLF